MPFKSQISNLKFQIPKPQFFKSQISDFKFQILLLASLSLAVGCSSLGISRKSAHPGRSAKVLSGLDVLVRDDFSQLKGKKIGLITNHSALTRDGKHILDVMTASGNVKIVALFGPEHGLRGTADEKVTNSIDEKTGLPIYSLYGETRRPTPEMLKGVDTLVFDIQDIGARFYTYISTMAMAMEEAKKNNLEFIVLDRPNPIGGLYVAGPSQDPDLYGTFTNYFPMPITHGMTIGELATMFNRTFGIDCKLTVIKMQGWRRDLYFDQTGLPWVNPSPNIRNVNEEILYPGIALVEGTNVSVGRGTDAPFELVGAPYIYAEELTRQMNSYQLPGVKFEPATFEPKGSQFSGKQCQGMRVHITDRESFDTVRTGLFLVSALQKLYGKTFEIDKLRGLIGSGKVIAQIKQDVPVDVIITGYRPALSAFSNDRLQHLLY